MNYFYSFSENYNSPVYYYHHHHHHDHYYNCSYHLFSLSSARMGANNLGKFTALIAAVNLIQFLD